MDKIEKIKEKLEKATGKEKATLMTELARAYGSSDPKKSEQLALKALSFSKKNNYQTPIALSNHIIGMSFHRRGEYQKALDFYQKGLKFFTKIGDKHRIASAKNNIGAIHELLSNYNKALEYYFQSVKIWEALKDKQKISLVFNNIGIIHEKIGNFDRAMEYHLKAIKIREKSGNLSDLAVSLSNLGNVYSQKENYNEALKYHFRALKLKEKDGKKNQLTVGISYTNIGHDYLDQTKFEDAILYFKKGLAVFQSHSHKYGLLQVKQSLGFTYSKIHNNKLAIKYLLEGLNLADKLGVQSKKLQIQLDLAEIYQNKKEYKKALSYLSEHMDLYKKVHNEKKSKQIAEMQTKYDMEKKEKETEIYRLRNIDLQKQIVEKKSAEEKFKKTRKGLSTLNKILRHDLANDFIVIKSAVNLFKNESQTEMLDEIEKRVELSLKTIDKLRHYESYINSNEDLIEVDVAEYIRKVVAEFTEIEINLEGSCVAFADDSLDSVFKNLINNAIIHGKATKIDIAISAKDHFCEIRIKDNGSGIPLEIRDKVFDEGFHYGETGNTGMGLHIVKRSIENYGGFIYIEDNQPQGVIFVISLEKVLDNL